MEYMDLVSIITPLYNSEKFILQTAKSVLEQTYTNWEWIIIDDCSTDSSLQLVTELARQDSRVKIIRNTINLRTSKTRNRGIEEAKGKYIAFIDSDDIWLKEKLETQIHYMKSKNLLFTYHPYKKFYESEKIVGHSIYVPDRVNHEDLLKTCSIGTLSVVYDQEALGKMYMGELDKREDFICWLSILKKIDFGYRVDKPLALYRIDKKSYSSNKLEVAKLQWRVYREFEGFNPFKSMIYFMFYSLYGYLKHKII